MNIQARAFHGATSHLRVREEGPLEVGVRHDKPVQRDGSLGGEVLEADEALELIAPATGR